MMHRLEDRLLLAATPPDEGHSHAPDSHGDEAITPSLLEGPGEVIADPPLQLPAPGSNLTLTAALLVDANNNPITTPAVGQMIFIRAQWTRGLLASANYVVRYWVDGVPLDSSGISNGAGNGNSSWYRGGWYASPGQHTVEVTVDGADTVPETNESDNTLTFSFTPASPTTLPQKFVAPIRGAQSQDWTIVNYVDVDPRPDLRADYLGGPFQYDGHGGWDLTVSNFAKMDASAAIVAAAAGTVTSVSDGNFDRETAFNSNPANYVQITHGNGWETEYYHFAANIITVKPGDTVSAGQLIGLMGSSGNSTGAHLHFQVRHDDALVETSFDPAGYWQSPLPYQANAPALVLDQGITNYEPSPDIKERPSDVEALPNGSPWTAYFWFRFSNLKAGDQVRVRWYRPDGTLAGTGAHDPTAAERYSWWWWSRTRTLWGTSPGTWQVAVSINNVEVSRRSFQVIPDIGGPEMKVYQGSTFLIDGRTTPINFGFADVGFRSVSLPFTVQNHGDVPLALTGITLPPGFSLVGSLPASVPAGGSAGLTLRLDDLRGGAKFGQVAITSNDGDESPYTFNVSGTVDGAVPPGTPALALPGAAVAFVPGSPPVLIDPGAQISDLDSPHLGGGQVTLEMAGITSGDDRLSVRNQGAAAGQIGVNSAVVSFGQVAIGTLAGGIGAAPLTISLNASATLPAVQALLRNLTYGSVAAFPNAVRRYLRLTVTDDTGKISNMAVKTIAFDTIAPSAVPFAWMVGSRLNVRFEDGVAAQIGIGSSGNTDTATRGALSLPFTGATEIVVFGTPGGDQLRITSPIARPMTFYNLGGNDGIELVSGAHVFAADISPALGNIAMTVGDGSSAMFQSDQHLRALTANGAARIAPGGDKTVDVRDIAVGPEGFLDLADNTLRVSYTGASPIANVTQLLAAGRNGGSWNGNGINSSSIDDKRLSLGIAELSQMGAAGQAVVVKLTYAGDANLDGVIDADDYICIDDGIAARRTGWFNGDFSYDGKVNIDDYVIIDQVIRIQGPPLVPPSQMGWVGQPALAWGDGEEGNDKMPDLLNFTVV